MQTTWTRLAFLVLNAVVLLAASISASCHFRRSLQDHSSVIAVVGDINERGLESSSGDATRGASSELAIDMARGVRLARDHYSRSFRLHCRDGTVEPVSVQTRKTFPDVVYLSDDGTSSGALRVSLNLAFRGETTVVIGHSRSSTTVEASSIYASCGIPLLMPIATSRELGESQAPDGADFRFRLPPSDVHQAKAIVKEVSSIIADTKKALSNDDARHSARVVLLAIADSYGRPIADDIFAGLRRQSIACQPPLTYPSRTTDHTGWQSALHTYSQEIRSAPPTVVVVAGYAEDAIYLAQSLRPNWRGPMVLSDGCLEPTLLSATPDLSPCFICFPGQRRNTPNFDDDFRKMYPKASTVRTYSPYGYDAYAVAIDAINTVPGDGLSVSSTELCLQLRALLQNYDGLGSPYSMAADVRVETQRDPLYSWFSLRSDLANTSAELEVVK